MVVSNVEIRMGVARTTIRTRVGAPRVFAMRFAAPNHGGQFFYLGVRIKLQHPDCDD
jgi:hypothetical protein